MDEPEVKQEFDFFVHLQCRTCLSLGRKLVPLGKYNEIYRKLISNVEYYDMLLPEQIQVCWECEALLRQAAKFQLRVEKTCEVLKLGQSCAYGPLSSLTTIVLSDTYLNTIYINDQVKTLSEITKSERIQELEEFYNEDYIDGTEETAADNSQQEFDIETDIKTEINLDVGYTKEETQSNLDVEYAKEETKSKQSKKWALKKAQQNKKPKFRVLTNEDINKIIRVERIDAVELQNYLQSKKNSESYQTKRYRCETCVIGFKDNNGYLKHNKKYHEKSIGPYCCDVCASNFKDKRSLMPHLSKHYNKYICLICEYHSYCAKERRRHAERHMKVYQCLKCELTFGTRREFYKHYKEWHEKFICDHCGKSFKMRYCIKNHIRKQHSPFKCVPCNKRFANYNGLWMHNKTHHTAPSSGEGGYCVECDKHYPNVYKYRSHLVNSVRHKPRKKIRIPCPGCDKFFSKKIYMKNHFNFVHLKCYDFRCEECDKNFIRNADLVTHRRRVHEGILPPRNKICYTCGRGFTTNKILNNHMRTHTGERPFACALCPARFAQSAALASHTRALHRAHTATE